MRKYTKRELEDMDNAIIYDSDNGKTYCPRCGTEIIEVVNFYNKCPDETCGWRQYTRNRKTGEKTSVRRRCRVTRTLSHSDNTTGPSV